MKIQDERNDKFKKNMRRAFWLMLLFFFALSIYFVKLIFIDSESIITNSYNTRMKIQDENVKRGSILDTNGKILAESTLDTDIYVRTYPYSKTLSHVTGYSDLSKSGVENKFNFDLQKIRFEIYQRIKQLAIDTEVEANNVVLTIDADLSEYISEQLGQRTGSVVVMEPSTGKILSMVSYPNFDPATVEETWDELMNSEGSPLLNRASQGLYIPGSIFKIATASTAIESMPDWESFTYECTGEAYIGDSNIICYNNRAHGLVDMEKAFAVSCNTFFAQIGVKLSSTEKEKTVSDFFIDKPYDFSLGYTSGSYSLGDDSTTSEIIETAIGQGKTLVTPLNMAMMASAIANNGLLMNPYVVDRIESASGDATTKKYLPASLGQAVDPSNAQILTQMMIACVNDGTGAPSSISGIQVAGKTGTAQNPAGEDHSWFVGFAPADDPQIAFAVLLENSGPGGKSLALSKSMLDYYFNK